MLNNICSADTDIGFTSKGTFLDFLKWRIFVLCRDSSVVKPSLKVIRHRKGDRRNTPAPADTALGRANNLHWRFKGSYCESRISSEARDMRRLQNSCLKM